MATTQLLAVADGDLQELDRTPSDPVFYTAIDDPVASPDSTDYLEMSASLGEGLVRKEALFRFTTCPPLRDITKVAVQASLISPANNENEEVWPLCRFKGTDAVGSSATPLPLAYTLRELSLGATNPVTSGAWRWIDLQRGSVQIGVRCEIDTEDLAGDLRMRQAYLEITSASNRIAFNTAAGGSAFAFFEAADYALVDYLTATGNSNANLANVASYLNTTATWEPHEFTDNPRVIGGPNRFPLVHLGSYLEDLRDFDGGIMVSGRTRFLVWDDQPNPNDAAGRVMEVAGAIQSALEQTPLSNAGTDWEVHFANHMPETIATKINGLPSQFIQNDNGEMTGRAGAEVTVRWSHRETV